MSRFLSYFSSEKFIFFQFSLPLSSCFSTQLWSEPSRFFGFVLAHCCHGQLKKGGIQGGTIRQPVPRELAP